MKGWNWKELDSRADYRSSLSPSNQRVFSEFPFLPFLPFLSSSFHLQSYLLLTSAISAKPRLDIVIIFSRISSLLIPYSSPFRYHYHILPYKYKPALILPYLVSLLNFDLAFNSSYAYEVVSLLSFGLPISHPDSCLPLPSTSYHRDKSNALPALQLPQRLS